MKNLGLIFVLVLLSACSGTKPVINISGNENSDIVIALKQDYKINIYKTPLEAVLNSDQNEALLILAGDYPGNRVELDEDIFKLLIEKGLRAYIEYPSWLPGINVGDIVSDSHQRAVVNSSFFGGFPDSLDILVANGMSYSKLPLVSSHILAAKVAGFDEAVYGLPEKTSPLLFELPGHQILISSTSLSNPVKGRFAPVESWEKVWEHILQYVNDDNQVDIEFHSDVNPTYQKNEELPASHQKLAVQKGIEWYKGARMLPDKSSFDSIKKMDVPHLLYLSDTMKPGVGSYGVLEATMSVIDYDGSQPVGVVQRGDCHGETALAFAAAGKSLDSEEYMKTAENILDYYLFESGARTGQWVDPDNGAYGLIPWGITNYAWYRANYGDDNARLLLGILGTAAITNNQEWDDIAMRCLVAQLRTTGVNGFRGNRIDLPDFDKYGWGTYFNRDIINMAPHFESYLWACFLWAYDKTAYQPFLEKTKKAIYTTMEGYPDKWRWTNGMTQEKARMILCLSWLVRVEDTPLHREYLQRVVYDLIELQDESGAIREELGNLKMGVYPPPQSNEAYGTNEASLLGRNGDKVSDLLYSTNFAFLGLHEAAFATQDPKITRAADKLAKFLCRIQVDAPIHPEIHGSWFRAFDYGRYEHWGCNADLGWGAWCVESGWTQGWITTVLALREMDISYWDLTNNSEVAQNFQVILKEMGL